MVKWVLTIFSECLGWRLRDLQEELEDGGRMVDLMGMEVMGLLV